MSTEIKRKAQTELAKAAKREKIEEENFIKRMSKENSNKRINQQLDIVQRVCEDLDKKKVFLLPFFNNLYIRT